jgi:hypothetical protein
METFFKINLAVHVLAGFTGFFVAPVAMIVKKGGAAHRLWGWVYVYAMGIAALTALLASAFKNNWFFISLAVFSFYAAFAGVRVMNLKRIHKMDKVPFIDWMAAVLNILFSLFLVVLGAINLPKAFGYVAIVFGLIGINNGLRDVKKFMQRKEDKQRWLFDHIGGMLGSYIAAVSAFSVNNLNFEWMPAVVTWLWPTVIGVPAMMKWMNYYKRKLSKGKTLNELVQVSTQGY